MPTIYRTYSGLVIPSLVQSLAYLQQLGMVRTVLILAILSINRLQTISSAKKDVYDFTTQVSTWFYSVETSSGGTIRNLACKRKKNLSVIRYVLSLSFPQRIAECNRDSINVIYKWGWARVVRLDHNRFLDAIHYA